MEEQLEAGKVATNLVAKFIDAGLVRQTDEDEFTVHGSQGDQKFKTYDQD